METEAENNAKPTEQSGDTSSSEQVQKNERAQSDQATPEQADKQKTSSTSANAKPTVSKEKTADSKEKESQAKSPKNRGKSSQSTQATNAQPATKQQDKKSSTAKSSNVGSGSNKVQSKNAQTKASQTKASQAKKSAASANTKPKQHTKTPANDQAEKKTVGKPLVADSKQTTPSEKNNKSVLPVIAERHEHRNIISRLPTQRSSWPQDKDSCNSIARSPSKMPDKFTKRKLKWPKRPVVFISDPHADATAFEASLVASGVVIQKKEGLQNLKLTKVGQKSEIIIGGDCLDKGPSNLSLLRSVKHLYELDARVTLLAGNHDLRLLMGLLALKSKKHNIGNQHFFVRMGKKVIPLFQEVFEQYLDGTKWDKKIPDEDECRKILFPDDKWFKEFPYHAAGILTAEGIEREVHKMRSKASSFERNCASVGLTLRHVYAASRQCEKLFLDKKGEFSWFFRKMRLVEKRGSFLFLHAGLDDAMAELLLKNGTMYANKAFHRNLKHMDLFGFYYSSIANTFRTKYRDADLPLTERGVNAVHKAGVHFVVQGHINRQGGQRIAIKKGLIHIEADITLDEHSRQREGLLGYGIGATLISKKQGLIGLSCDYPTAKVLQPNELREIYG